MFFNLIEILTVCWHHLIRNAPPRFRKSSTSFVFCQAGFFGKFLFFEMKKKRKKITTEKGKRDRFLSEQFGGEQRQLCGEQSDLKNAH